jgi:predicted phage terminase large subunit-like protein
MKVLARIPGLPANLPQAIVSHHRHPDTLLEPGTFGDRTHIRLALQASQTILHGCVKWFEEDPTSKIIYSSYNQDIANTQSREARDVATRARLPLRSDAGAVELWMTQAGGAFRAAGVGAGITGFPGQKIVFDDPYKNREEAESPAIRQKVWDHYSSTLETRLHPGGSFFVVHTRWDPDDLIGALSKQVNRDGSKRWEVVNLPAILPSGEPLWPEERPLDWLLDKRVGMSEYDWWALWMGDPRPRGRTLFRAPHFYEPSERPRSGYRIVIGADFAYSIKKKADWSVAVVLMQVGHGEQSTTYVLDVVRVQVEAPAFQEKLLELSETWSAPVFGYIGGGAEKGVTDFMSERENGKSLNIETQSTSADKYARAQATARAWNKGRVLLPRGAPWLNDFVTEVTNFTGSDKHDDQVDALVGGFDKLNSYGGPPAMAPPSPPVALPNRWGSDRGF